MLSPESGTVLVVDDDAAVRSALKFALEVEGFKVRLYAGAEALLADQNLPQRACLVVDYRMPGIDGLALIGILRARHVTVPVILISGRISEQLLAGAERFGAVRVLEKPLSDAALVEGIRSALGPAG